MAHGVVPVVTAASSGIAGVINHSENGFVVPVGNMSAMADAIAHLVENPSLLQSVGESAHRTVRTYSMDAYAERFATILDDVAATDQGYDYEQRYGMFSPQHPILVQREFIEQQQAEIRELGKRTRGRLWKDGLHRLRRSAGWPNTRGDSQAAA